MRVSLVPFPTGQPEDADTMAKPLKWLKMWKLSKTAISNRCGGVEVKLTRWLQRCPPLGWIALHLRASDRFGQAPCFFKAARYCAATSPVAKRCGNIRAKTLPIRLVRPEMCR